MSGGGNIALTVIFSVIGVCLLVFLPMFLAGKHYKCVNNTYPCKYYPWKWNYQTKNNCNSTCGLCASWCSNGNSPNTNCKDSAGNTGNCCTINPDSCSGCAVCKASPSPT